MTTLVLLALCIAIVFVAYELHESILPQYRKGCNECDAARRQAVEAQRKVDHDYAHEHGFECGDKQCPRNKLDA